MPKKLTKQLWVKLDEESANRLLREAKKLGFSRASLMRLIIMKKLNDHKNINLNHLIQK